MILHGLDALTEFFAKTQILDLRNSYNAPVKIKIKHILIYPCK